MEDELYADWCLENNWFRFDENTARYILGEGYEDDRWKKWIEEVMK